MFRRTPATIRFLDSEKFPDNSLHVIFSPDTTGDSTPLHILFTPCVPSSDNDAEFRDVYMFVYNEFHDVYLALSANRPIETSRIDELYSALYAHFKS